MQVLHILQDDEGESEELWRGFAEWYERRTQAHPQRILGDA